MTTTVASNVSKATANNSTTTLVVWNPQLEELVKKTIADGGSVTKEIAVCAPKGFISKLRAERRGVIEKQSGRILGEFAQQGFIVGDMKAKQTSERTGQETVWVKMIKKADPMVEFAGKLGVDVEALRLAISGLAAKK